MKILIIDNFDSFTFNLVDYFKRLECEVVVYRNTIDPSKIDAEVPDLIVFSPGPSVPKNAGNIMKIIDLYHKKYPMFGVCLGHQALIEYFGGELKFVAPVHGKSSAISHDGQTIFENIPNRFMAGRYHSLAAKRVPDCFTVSALHDDIVMAIRHKELPIEGVQFHPESVLTMKGEQGIKMIQNVLEHLVITQKKSASSLISFLKASIEGRLSITEQEEFLRSKKEVSAQELADVVDYLQGKMSMQVELPNAIDVCGTGGSVLLRINTSTIAAFVLSSLGVGVAKHGNRAASGRVGSFDVLEALGIGFQENAREIEHMYKKTKLAFLFARTFHPVMKHFAEVRQKIGAPTFFNILGPLLSPAHVQRQVIGTAFRDKMHLIAEAARLLGKERIAVVCGEDGLDEVTLTGTTHVVELKNGKIEKYSLRPEDFGVQPAKFSEIEGGTLSENKEIAERILSGKSKTRHTDLILMNCALALRIAGIEEDVKRGFVLAKSALAAGKAHASLEQARMYSNIPSILLEIVQNKMGEVEERKMQTPLANFKQNLSCSDRSFKRSLRSAVEHAGPDSGLVRVISEIKRASPSAGTLRDAENFSPLAIAQQYEAAKVAAISVLTDTKYFGGRLEDLTQVSAATQRTPLLCKDFIIDEYQIYEARTYGADAILLIAAILTEDQIKRFIAIARELKMDALCEVHTEEEVLKVLAAGAEIIGINNRDLHTFEIDLQTTHDLAPLIPKSKIIVSESGFVSGEDVAQLPPNVNAILVGTSLMRAQNIPEKLDELMNAKSLSSTF
ncbi:anthranilate phosphoribosyltransferase [Candidatus Peregrinibacteria bacterium CG11_big_fil_rev_8_21_14_0_20_46_8]|nr:MAG: anthranilate phosphoribosyltransferase [Candidatus Peregrinibacteria bacterium CG11_big_fil_rev_8_21_14_0_20_46_8]